MVKLERKFQMHPTLAAEQCCPQPPWKNNGGLAWSAVTKRLGTNATRTGAAKVRRRRGDDAQCPVMDCKTALLSISSANTTEIEPPQQIFARQLIFEKTIVPIFTFPLNYTHSSWPNTRHPGHSLHSCINTKIRNVAIWFKASALFTNYNNFHTLWFQHFTRNDSACPPMRKYLCSFSQHGSILIGIFFFPVTSELFSTTVWNFLQRRSWNYIQLTLCSLPMYGKT